MRGFWIVIGVLGGLLALAGLVMLVLGAVSGNLIRVVFSLVAVMGGMSCALQSVAYLD